MRTFFRTLSDTFSFFVLWARLECLALFGSAKKSRAIGLNPQQAGLRHALLLSFFPPMITGGVYRPLSLAKYAHRSQWHIDVLTAHSGEEVSPPAQALLKEVPPDVGVYRPAMKKLQPAWSISQKVEVDGGLVNALTLAKWGIKNLSDELFDVIVASGPSFSYFITGYLISKSFGRPLVLDYRDEWSENPFSFVKRTSFGGKWEKRCLAHAKKVIFTTDSQKEHACDIFGQSVYDKSIVIRNGWDEEHRGNPDLLGQKPKPTPHSIVFAGYIGLHAPFHLFLEDLRQSAQRKPALVENYQISVVGSQPPEVISQTKSSPLGSIVVFEPQLPITDVITRLNSGRIGLIIVTKDFERYIPGKLYYYLASDIPILVFGAPGETKNIVEELDAGIFVEDGNPEKLIDALATFDREPASRWNNQARKDWLISHTRANRADAFFKALDELV
ncbi:MAG: hypothetical protein Q7N95_10520 [Alphaproteobacteria bacterium]|nr:hypothetical protein [Alphaproteobacteria bacterium]